MIKITVNLGLREDRCSGLLLKKKPYQRNAVRKSNKNYGWINDVRIYVHVKFGVE